MLGAAVIGLGVGEQHARAYAESPHSVLRWVYDLDPDRMQRVVAAIGQGAAARRFEDVVSDRAVDVVSIASYDDAHYAQVLAALDGGKHVFVEKPLCRSAAEARAIRARWQTAGRPHLASNLVLRAAPLYRWLREAIGSGELGEIYAFDGDYLYGRLQKITLEWRSQVDDYSVMQGGGIHLVDLMIWMTGQRPHAVSALGNRLCTNGSAFRYLDFVSAAFEFPSGLVGRITANFGCTHPHQHVVRVFGTKATVILDDRGPRLFTSRDPATPPSVLDLPALPASKGALIPGFLDRIVRGEDPGPPFDHELAVVAACHAADQAVREAQPQRIEYGD